MASPPEPSSRPLLRVAALTLITATGVALLLRRVVRPSEERTVRAAQALGAGAAVLCLSVALDSGLEHYRGRFEDRAMFVGPTIATIGLATAIYTTLYPMQSGSRHARLLFGATAVTGAIGLGFHAYNILKRPGELDELNLFYAAPAGAPAALTLAGGFGLLAAKFAQTPDALVSVPYARIAAAAVAVGLVGTVAEAGLLHFRGAFQDPAMYLPVTIPPAAALATAAAIPLARAGKVADPLLQATAVLGIAGSIFHAYGIHRNMGGWRNWSQMILQGPPLPAPPAFLGLAIAGLGTLPLIREGRR